MGYACPVCEEPQADGEHLANHLAFSALLGRSAHADWLDEHAPGWDEEGPETLAERVTPHAEAVDLPEVTDADLPDPPAGAGGPPGAAGLEDALARGGGAGRERLDAETRQVIEEARSLTRRRSAEASGDADEPGRTAGDGGDGEPDGGDRADGERGTGDPDDGDAGDDNGK